MILGPYMVLINNEDIRNNSRISNQYADVPKTLNEHDRKYMINKKQNHLYALITNLFINM